MSDNPVNKLPDWIKRSGWIRENGELPGAKEPIDPIDIEPVNDTPFDESFQSLDQEIIKSDENQSSPDDTETLQQAVDSLNLEDLPSEITDVSLDNEIGSVSVDLTEDPNEISSVEATITSGEAIVQFPETGKNDVELVQSDNFLTDLPSIPEDLENSDKFEDLPEWLKNYEPVMQDKETSIVESNDNLTPPELNETSPGDDEAFVNSIRTNETPEIPQSSPSESLAPDEIAADQPLSPEDTTTDGGSAEVIIEDLPTEEDLPVIVPPPLPSSFDDQSSSHDEQALHNTENESLSLSPDVEFIEETVTIEEIEESSLETISANGDDIIEATELSAGVTEATEPDEGALSTSAEGNLDPHSDPVHPEVQPDTIEIPPSKPEVNPEDVASASIHVEDVPSIDDHLEIITTEIVSLVMNNDYSTVDKLLQEYHSLPDTNNLLLLRLEEVSEEQIDSPEYWQLVGDLMSKSGNLEEALDAYRLSEKILNK